jgi:hypothetical protein
VTRSVAFISCELILICLEANMGHGLGLLELMFICWEANMGWLQHWEVGHEAVKHGIRGKWNCFVLSTTYKRKEKWTVGYSS